jgi:hypothetical protein
MKVSLADLTDRYTIVKLKIEHGVVDAKREFIAVLAAMMEEASEACLTQFEIFSYVNRLREVNAAIWELEKDLRAGKEGMMTLQDIGRRALQIRDLNKKRVEIKNELVGIAGSGFPDIKVQHASE